MNEKGEITTNTKEIQMIFKNILWAAICEQIRQSRRNGHISGKPQTTKTGTGRNRKPEQAKNQGKNWKQSSKTSQDTKVQGQMASQENSIKHLKKKQYLFY